MSESRQRKSSTGPGPGALGWLGAFLARRPRFAVVVWVGLMAVLGLLGHNLDDRLQAHPIYVNGTDAQRAHEITLEKFGSDESMIIALHGPSAAVERQGRRLAASLDALPKTLVISPWSAGAPIEGIRPRPQVAGIIVRVGHRPEEALAKMVELVEGRIDDTVSAPVEASIAGLPKVFESYSEAISSSAKTGEMIALPILVLILLLVFRSVLAALIPVAIGGAVVAGTEGVMRLLLGVVQIDAFALGAAAMMGLAFGVDYSLLIVSRFREERHKRDLPSAVQVTVAATGRSIIPAGMGVLLAMLVAYQLVPGAAVKSDALAIMIATLLSMFSALWVAPAAVFLLAGNLDRWSLPERFALADTPLRLSRRISRKPFAVAAVVLMVLVLGGLATTLNSAVATPELLPAGSSGRVDGEEVERTLGPGWLAPIEVVVDGRGEPMTSPGRLHALAAFQDRVEGDDGVQSMAGFSDIERSMRPLSEFEGQLVDQQHAALRLDAGLSRLARGATAGANGLAGAAAGAGRLGSGVGSAAAGAGLLARGLDAAHAGSSQLTLGLASASDGSDRLASGISTAGSNAGRLAGALDEAQKQVTETQGTVQATKSAMRLGDTRLDETRDPLERAEDRLAAARQAMQQMTTGSTDPKYASAQQAVREASEYLNGIEPETGEAQDSLNGGVSAGIARAQRQFDLGLYLAGKMAEGNDRAATSTEKLADASQKLDRGIQSLSEGARRLSEGVISLHEHGGELSPALRRLSEGTEALESSLGRLGVGAGGLTRGLAGGAQGQESLASALGRVGSRLDAQSGDGGSRLDRLRERSPGLFDSGYFYLASLDGADPSRREQASLLIDLDQGGQAARMMVIPRYPSMTSEGRATLERVHEDAQALARKTGAEVMVGGLAASQVSIDHAFRDRTAVARLVLMGITLLVLIFVLRSLVVPIIAMFLNLLTVSACLGFLALMFDGSLLGGPGYVDSAIIPALVMVTFGLAIDYEVFIFARMREEYLRTGSTTAAVDNGLLRTAPVVTGAAFVMIAVFLSFSVSNFATLRSFSIGLAMAVFIDAFIIRLIVLPALMKALGKWSWWMPRWLDRLLPGDQGTPGGGAPRFAQRVRSGPSESGGA